jgi:hypothetical protein
MMLGRRWLDLAFCRKLELAQRLEIELEDVLDRPVLQSVCDRPVAPGPVGVLEELRLSGTCTIENPPFSM